MVHTFYNVWMYTTIVVIVHYCSFYLLGFGFMSSVFVIYQFCSLSYRDVPLHKGKYSTAIIVSLQLFLSEPARTVNGTYTGQAGILIEGIKFVILAFPYALACVCACACVYIVYRKHFITLAHTKSSAIGTK